MKNVTRAVVVAVLLGILYLLLFGYNDCNTQDSNTVMENSVEVSTNEKN